jgi:hypothetical protein
MEALMTILDPGVDETPADLKRMNQIQAELTAFFTELEAEIEAKKAASGRMS